MSTLPADIAATVNDITVQLQETNSPAICRGEAMGRYFCTAYGNVSPRLARTTRWQMYHTGEVAGDKVSRWVKVSPAASPLPNNVDYRPLSAIICLYQKGCCL